MKIIEMQNETTLEIDISIMEKIAQELSSRTVELLIVNENEMKELNRTHRGKEGSTDVLSFPLENPFPEGDDIKVPLGSIVISEKETREASKLFSHSVSNETTLLFVHGLLHLLGYDHESDDGQMRAYEEKIIEKYKLPSSLIVRNY